MNIGLIGINMYSKYLNFACVLHTYAFQQFLLQHGIESTVIDYKPVYFNNFDMAHPADYYQKLYEKKASTPAATPEEKEKQEAALADLNKKIKAWTALHDEREVRYEKFQTFIQQHYRKTAETYDSDLLEVKDPGFDCYICATDVIWGLLPTYTYDRGFFLASKCMDGKEKISYAASRGVPVPLTDDQENLFFHYLQDFDSLSVREQSLQQFIADRSQRKASLVLDPVLLHTKDFWQKIAVKPKEENYLVLYYVMERAADTIKAAVEYARLHDLLIVELSDRPVKEGRVTDPDVKHVNKYDIGPEEWLGYLEHAECIFTNSFHGCCFAALFEKKFFAGKRDGDKVTNILQTLGLEDRRLRPEPSSRLKRKINSFANKGHAFNDIPETIDYAAVSARLNKKRKESTDFLLQAIRDGEQRFENGEKKSKTDYEAFRRQLTFSVHYHSGRSNVSHTYDLEQPGTRFQKFPSGNCEYSKKDRLYRNDGSDTFEKNRYVLNGAHFIGWRIRIKIDNKWFWYMNDGSLGRKEDYGIDFNQKKKIFPDEGQIPYIPVNQIRLIVAEAAWETKTWGSIRKLLTRKG